MVVVAGAGMSGLYATLQFFRAGMHVTMVNDRSEQYERALIIGFDMNWREQARFFLGSKFAEMFGEENPAGRLSPTNSSLWIQLRTLETAFKDRLLELAKFAAIKTDPKKNLCICFITTKFRPSNFQLTRIPVTMLC
uniref:Uncharacterized protein n=1 Tax=Ditylenchus dipsaci TaxID=166011 RepID=A0A915DF10_9BILA